MDVMHRYLTEKEQGQLDAMLKQFASVLARRDRAWIGLLLRTGCRIGEFSLLTVHDARFALETGWLYIPRAHRKGKSSDHSVPVTAPMREDLERLLSIHSMMGGGGEDDEPLVISRKHGRMSVRAYQDRLDHWTRRCGFHASPHWMRHTRAMNIMRRSKSTDPRGIVQGALGHTSISSTGIYTRLSKEELQRRLEELDNPSRLRKRQVRRAYEGRA